MTKLLAAALLALLRRRFRADARRRPTGRPAEPAAARGRRAARHAARRLRTSATPTASRSALSGGIGYRIGDLTLRGLFDYYRSATARDEAMQRHGRAHAVRRRGCATRSRTPAPTRRRSRDFWGEARRRLRARRVAARRRARSPERASSRSASISAAAATDAHGAAARSATSWTSARSSREAPARWPARWRPAAVRARAATTPPRTDVRCSSSSASTGAAELPHERIRTCCPQAGCCGTRWSRHASLLAACGGSATTRCGAADGRHDERHAPAIARRRAATRRRRVASYAPAHASAQLEPAHPRYELRSRRSPSRCPIAPASARRSASRCTRRSASRRSCARGASPWAEVLLHYNDAEGVARARRSTSARVPQPLEVYAGDGSLVGRARRRRRPHPARLRRRRPLADHRRGRRALPDRRAQRDDRARSRSSPRSMAST